MNPERLRQIAILVDSLDTAQADRLLEQLPDDAQQQVRNAVFNLTDVDEHERKTIIQNFVSRNKGEAKPSSIPTANPGSGTYGDPRSAATRAYATSTSRTDLKTDAGQAVPEYQKYLNRREPVDDTMTPNRQPKERLPSDHGDRHSSQNTMNEPDLVDALSQADIETLAAVVIKETPQVLAVVLSMLPADKSTRLLELFPATQRLDALHRLSQLDEIDEQVLDYLQQQLDRVVRRRVKLKRNQRSGPQALAAILSAAHRLQSQEVVSSIHQQFRPNVNHIDAMPGTKLETVNSSPLVNSPKSPDNHTESRRQDSTLDANESTASQLLQRAAEGKSDSATYSVERKPRHQTTGLSKPSEEPEERLASAEVNQVDAFSDVEIRFDFAKLVNCDRDSLEALLATAKPKLTLLALRGATPKLLARVLRLLPANEAKEVEYRIQNLGPTRLQDIHQAQSYLLRLATVLEDMGRFRRPRKSLLSF